MSHPLTTGNTIMYLSTMTDPHCCLENLSPALLLLILTYLRILTRSTAFLEHHRPHIVFLTLKVLQYQDGLIVW